MIRKMFAKLGVVLVFALAITACTMAQTPGLGAPDGVPAIYQGEDIDLENRRKVIVIGTAEITADPDEAWGILGVETLNKDAAVAQEENAEKMEAVMDALKKAGIKKDDIETQSFNLHRQTKWNSNTRESEFVGYRVSHDIKFKTTDIENVGKYLDVAVKAGANDIRSVSFGLSDTAKEQMSIDLLTQAAETGKQKAIILAEALDARVGQILEISESNYHVQPVYARGIHAVPEHPAFSQSSSTTQSTGGGA